MTIEKNALKRIAEYICVAARTSPKGKGLDNLYFKILTKTEKAKLIIQMKKINKKHGSPAFLRDALNIEKAAEVILFGAKINQIGLKYCGLCGYKNCAENKKNKGICVFNTVDLGIALGSAVSTAMDFKTDNRVMYTAGIAAKDSGLLPKRVKIAFALPLSATGKNIFFDRK